MPLGNSASAAATGAAQRANLERAYSDAYTGTAQSGNTYSREANNSPTSRRRYYK